MPGPGFGNLRDGPRFVQAVFAGAEVGQEQTGRSVVESSSFPRHFRCDFNEQSMRRRRVCLETSHPKRPLDPGEPCQGSQLTPPEMQREVFPERASEM